jgi:Tat protein translocase TatB subunit
MFGIGMPELIVIFVIALIFIGPKKLPDLARALGKGMAEFRKATSDIKANLDVEDELDGMKEELVDSVSGLIVDASEAVDETDSKEGRTEEAQKEDQETDTAERKHSDG